MLRSVVVSLAGLLALSGLCRAEKFPAPPRPEAARSIGTGPVLFVDREFVAKSEGVRFRVHPPRKTNERLVVSDQPWENATLNWFSVLRDGDRYRMWYECYDRTGWPTPDDTSFCLAESVDGVRWTKPKLGLFEYQGGRENNILFRQVGEGTHRSRVHGSGVFVDPSAPPAERYKCVAQGQFRGIGERPYYVAMMTSPDGLRWTRLPKPICQVFADSQYSGFYDAARKEYALFGRVSGRGGRALGRSASPRFDRFEPLTRVLETDANDPPRADLYNPACQPYPGVSDLYLMFPSFFRHETDTLDIRLAVSRDGVKWTWPDRETAFVPLGKPGDFDGGSLYMANGGCVPTDDGFSFYFSGSALKHAETELENLTPARQRVYSRAVAQRDRLVSITADGAGWIETPPLRFTGNRLIIDAAARPNGFVRVGFVDANGQPVPGRAIDDCKKLEEDANLRTIAWTTGDDIGAWSDKNVRVRVETNRADLFSIRFVNAPKP